MSAAPTPEQMGECCDKCAFLATANCHRCRYGSGSDEAPVLFRPYEGER